MSDVPFATTGAMRFGPRSRPAREAILAAARRLFSTDGYEKTTVRAIAGAAGVDPSMVIRYYGSKADLYAVASAVDLQVIDLSGVPHGEVGRRFARHMLTRWEDGGNDAEVLLLRTGATEPLAAEGIQKIFTEQVLPALRSAFPGDPDIETRAGLVLSQGLGAVIARHLLRVEPLASMDFGLFADAVGDAMQLHLTRPLRSPGARQENRCTDEP
jgi:AcrR family transcriptional regulator